MATMKEFTQTEARPLPVLLLADISGSMAPEDKIGALNRSVAEMISEFSREEDLRAEIHVAVITFGGVAKEHIPLQPASQVTWQNMTANGGTPMGGAFDLASAMIEDRSRVPSRAYRPTIVLVSDGQPTDNGAWLTALENLNCSGRASKAYRMALAIGADADEDMLRRFVGNAGEQKIFRADEARQIREFFRYVTMSVVSRSRGANPNQDPGPTLTDLDELG